MVRYKRMFWKLFIHKSIFICGFYLGHKHTVDSMFTVCCRLFPSFETAHWHKTHSAVVCFIELFITKKAVHKFQWTHPMYKLRGEDKYRILLQWTEVSDVFFVFLFISTNDHKKTHIKERRLDLWCPEMLETLSGKRYKVLHIGGCLMITLWKK